MGLKKIYFGFLFRFTNWTFSFWQSLGLHVVPNHFYQPIPDTRYLPDSIWSNKSEMIGISINEEFQVSLIKDFKSKFYNEYTDFPTFKDSTTSDHQFYSNNAFFSPVDAEVLYCMIRLFKPKRIIEIGSGFTTYISAQASEVNRINYGINNELIAIEPYPNAVLKKGFPGLTRLIDLKLQEIDIEYFDSLEDGDILFIDSSHILSIGSDVAYEFLEILPRLKKGVIIHIHDIYLPYEYPKSMIFQEKKFYNEQYLLQALLIDNHNFEVMFAGYYMHMNHKNLLQSTFPKYNADGSQTPVSFWIRRL